MKYTPLLFEIYYTFLVFQLLQASRLDRFLCLICQMMWFGVYIYTSIEADHNMWASPGPGVASCWSAAVTFGAGHAWTLSAPSSTAACARDQ